MIDIDKVKAAFATTTKFCQNSFHRPTDGGVAVCAVTALTVYAGMDIDLVGKFVRSDWMGGVMGGNSKFFAFAAPILEIEYGISREVAKRIVTCFDDEENEWKAVTAVITRIAVDLDVTVSHVSQVMKGVKRSPRVEAAIAQAIGKPVARVFPALKQTG